MKGWVLVEPEGVTGDDQLKGWIQRAVKFVGKATMSKIGASTKVVFSKAGTYRFTTKVGEDYMKGVKTVGEDNVLKLTVKVA